ncbi:hypothetical protein L1887_55093 [Cichorium endivia]|nr:hypothetical protein L1887_55093 [Cichorium endivia]
MSNRIVSTSTVTVFILCVCVCVCVGSQRRWWKTARSWKRGLFKGSKCAARPTLIVRLQLCERALQTSQNVPRLAPFPTSPGPAIQSVVSFPNAVGCVRHPWEFRRQLCRTVRVACERRTSFTDDAERLRLRARLGPIRARFFPTANLSTDSPTANSNTTAPNRRDGAERKVAACGRRYPRACRKVGVVGKWRSRQHRTANSGHQSGVSGRNAVDDYGRVGGASLPIEDDVVCGSEAKSAMTNAAGRVRISTADFSKRKK